MPKKGNVVLFDVRTVMFMTAAATGMLALCLAITLGRHGASIGRAAKVWANATALQSLAWCAFSQRDLIPDLFSVLAGNLMICLAYAEYPRALRIFHGDTSTWPTPRGIAVSVVVPVVFYTWINPDVALRAVTSSAVVMVLLLIAARETVRTAPRPWPTSHLLALAVFSGGALLLLVRMVFEVSSTRPLTSGMASTPMQIVTFSYLSLVPIIATLGFVLMCSEHANAELEKLATTDSLTGTLNRRKLELLAGEQINIARQRGHQVSLLLLDADRFKTINDLHGHEVGDFALKNMVACARQHLRPGDLIGRFGGEEFLVLLINTASSEAAQIAERLRAAVAALDLHVRGKSLCLSISVGVATLGEHGHDFQELVRRADRAMYLAKHRGRNRVVTGTPEWT
ncbi:MAG: GGDEF domain-containing protein [Rhodanobacteraceae bacterium]|nr:GGDEF domain-containing protein [Rhodanobacteraceae bacterium]